MEGHVVRTLNILTIKVDDTVTLRVRASGVIGAGEVLSGVRIACIRVHVVVGVVLSAHFEAGDKVCLGVTRHRVAIEVNQ